MSDADGIDRDQEAPAVDAVGADQAEVTAGADTVEAVADDASAAASPAAVPPLVETLEVEGGRVERTGAVDPAADIVAPDAADLAPGELRAAVEGLLFVATRPLAVERLQACLPGTSADYLNGFLAGLAERYDQERRGWELRHIAGGWQLMTRRDLYPWVRQLERRELPTHLSKSALETLAIVAYKQPLTRGAIEDIRGVQCGPVLRQLMDLKLVQVTGRDEDALGRPLLYATTDAFLARFGLGRIDDLPRRHEFGN
jgi:segregation and condensation protein B